MKNFLPLLLFSLLFNSTAFAACNFDYIPAPNSLNSTSSYTVPTGEVLTTSANSLPENLLTLVPVKTLDPYIIPIDGVEYYLVKDYGYGKWDLTDILGLGDKPDNLFAALKALDFDGDNTKLTPFELSYNRIRLVAKNPKGYLELKHPEKDFPINKVLYIDLNSIKSATADDINNGIYGYFDVVIKTDTNQTQTVTATLTFDHSKNLKKILKTK